MTSVTPLPRTPFDRRGRFREPILRRPRGFSLAELLIALAILVVLLTLAAPNYRDFVLDTRMTTEANDFVTALAFARSEAVKRDATVTVCKSADGAACTTSGNWQQGWIVFLDIPPATGTIGTFNAGTDTLLRVRGALDTTSSLIGTTDVANYISFGQDGRSLLANGAAQAGTLDLCPTAAGTVQGRRVTVALGRTAVTKISC